MANSPSPQTRWSPPSSIKAASGSGVTRYAGDARVLVTTAPEQSVVLIARASGGEPRAEFVDEVVRREFGTQANGDKHKWEILPEPKTEAVLIHVTDNERVNSFLEEKVNGPEIGA
jgi:hypothetical protein